MDLKPLLCAKHRKECKLIFDPFGFLIYLHCLYNELSKDLDDAEQTKISEDDLDFEQDEHPKKE
ncbi:hypothetical protein L7F22_010041, partial [Adiantum nelumboides]|nr:hypothetical protein [Adiantum nelumboides]